MKIHCPGCGQLVPTENIALDSGWAKCPTCNEVTRLSEILPGYPPAKGDLPKPPDRPFDARCLVEQNDRKLFVHVPAQGMGGGTLALLAFALFWLSFMAFWTAGAAGLLFFGNQPRGAVNVVFPLFSIPFWAIGLGMLGSVAWMAFGTQTMLIDAGRVIVERKCLLWRRRRIRDRESLQCARIGTSPFIASHRSAPSSPLFTVDVVYQGGSFALPCSSQSEQEWLITVINGFLKSVPYAPSTYLDSDPWESFSPITPGRPAV
jgi:hypothetical protein